MNETRICQDRPCKDYKNTNKNRCKASYRSGPSRLRIASCVSRKVFHPKLCNNCINSGKCCRPVKSTTIKVSLVCQHDGFSVPEDELDAVLDLLEPGANLWTPDEIMKEEPIENKFLYINMQTTENSEEEFIEKFYPILKSPDLEQRSVDVDSAEEESDRITPHVTKTHKKPSDFKLYPHSVAKRSSKEYDYGSSDESIITVNVQWVLKCECDHHCEGSGFSKKANRKKSNKTKRRRKKKHGARRMKSYVYKSFDFDESQTATAVQEMILHRVHRTTAP